MIGQSNGQLRAFIDRVLRLKGEQDTITDDIKEVYAEAKASGFDKTMMGKLVAHLRKVEKAGGVQKLNEEDALFDLYLKSYLQAGTDHADNTTRAHAHEAEFEAPRAAPSASVLWADPAISEHITTELRSPPSVESGKSAGADEIAVPSAPVLTEHDPETGEVFETPDERLSSSGQDGEVVPPNPAALTPETGGGACPGPASEIFTQAQAEFPPYMIVDPASPGTGGEAGAFTTTDNPLPDFLRRTKAVA